MKKTILICVIMFILLVIYAEVNDVYTEHQWSSLTEQLAEITGFEIGDWFYHFGNNKINSLRCTGYLIDNDGRICLTTFPFDCEFDAKLCFHSRDELKKNLIGRL